MLALSCLYDDGAPWTVAQHNVNTATSDVVSDERIAEQVSAGQLVAGEVYSSRRITLSIDNKASCSSAFDA